jgi:uncharacterized spore protein YtfJ
MALENIMKTMMDELKHIAKTETVVGKEIKAGTSTIIPVSKISLGVAGGGGTGKDRKEGEGLGGGASIEPIAFIVVNEDGRAQLLTMKDNADALSKVIDLIPGVLDKFTGKSPSHTDTDAKSA